MAELPEVKNEDFSGENEAQGGCSVIGSEAAIVVEKIVEEIVSIIADNSDSTPDVNFKAGDIIKLMLNGTGPYAEIGQGDGKAIISPKKTFVTDDESEQQKFEHLNPGSLQMSTSVGGTAKPCRSQAGDEEDATNALLLMQVLVNENKQLRERTGELQSAIRFVMSKYRSSITLLLNELDRCKQAYPKIVSMMDLTGQTDHENTPLLKRELQIDEMREVMREAAVLEDRAISYYENLLGKLCAENRGLRELIEASYKIGCGCKIESHDKCVQTEDFKISCGVGPMSPLKGWEDYFPLTEDDDSGSFYSAASSIACEIESRDDDSLDRSELDSPGSDCEYGNENISLLDSSSENEL